MDEACESQEVGGIGSDARPGLSAAAPALADSFEQVVDRFEGPLLRYARQLVGTSGDEAQDVVQEAFLRLHRYRDTDRARDIRHLSTWLYRVTHNLAMDVLRKRSRLRRGQQHLQQTSRAETSDPGEALMDLERRDLVDYAMRMVRRLPREQREALVLKLVEGLSIRQIAKVTESTPGSVAHRLNKAMTELTQRLKNNGAI